MAALGGFGMFLLLQVTVTIAPAKAPERLLQYNESLRTESVILYGNLHGYAYWFADLLIGTPPQRVSVIIDTGSSVCAFPCDTCPSCGKHIDPSFKMGSSSTSEVMQCTSDCLGSCNRENQCSYHVSYFEGSSIEGLWFTDLVQMGDRSEDNIPVKSTLGCHTSETKLFYTQLANGILGIGPPRPNSPPNLLHSLFADTRIDKKIFSICLSEEGGELVVGGHNSSYNTDEMHWISGQNPHSKFYQLEIESVGVSRHTGGHAGGQLHAILDTGSTLVYLPPIIYASMISEFAKLLVTNAASADVHVQARPDGRCFYTTSSGLSEKESLKEILSKNIPPIFFKFFSHSTDWPSSMYLYPVSLREVCLALGDSGQANQIILGAAWFVGKNIVFSQDKFGFSNAKCPSHVASHRPPPFIAVEPDPSEPPREDDVKADSTTSIDKVEPETTVNGKLSSPTGLVENRADDPPAVRSESVPSPPVNDQFAGDGESVAAGWIVVIFGGSLLIVASISLWKHNRASSRSSTLEMIPRTTYAAVVELEDLPPTPQAVACTESKPLSP